MLQKWFWFGRAHLSVLLILDQSLNEEIYWHFLCWTQTSVMPNYKYQLISSRTPNNIGFIFLRSLDSAFHEFLHAQQVAIWDLMG